MIDRFFAPLEVKLAGDSLAGELEGYGSVFGNTDSHGDMVVPGAFTASLARHKAAGTMPAMFVQHGPAMGGDPLPAGVWTEATEDGRGLRLKGRLSALDTDYGRRVRALVGDGALKGLSIGYRVSANGAAYGRKPGEPRRTLKAVDLVEISLVTAPSNQLAAVDSIKSALDSGALPTLREFEEFLRERGFSRSQATQIAERGFKSLIAREGAEGEASIQPDEAKALADLRETLRAFTL
ncbi:HK97 family phage prohead protease [Pseudoroseomonas cervicalis]|uniref:HK97 family phage prohead protease n=1 Tax=Teichococcus cervicalis TaxID=204525 RepID=UPI002788B4C1|nr:HK97 family phage prohead protease [Pseudoroseomonas cervicalis]MDQ1077999.1 HK97 family phage prohead protease [Pseudoroseomonas cervicalis]